MWRCDQVLITIHEIQVTFHTNYFERLILESWFTKLAKWILLSRYEQLRNPAIDLLTIFFFHKLPEQKNLILPTNRKRPAPFALRYFISWKLISIGTNLISSTSGAICSLWNIYKCLLHQIVREIVLLFVNNVHEKTSEGVKTVEILKACALFVICTRLTTLLSCYMKMH